MRATTGSGNSPQPAACDDQASRIAAGSVQVLGLQRSIGNRAVGRMLTGVSTPAVAKDASTPTVQRLAGKGVWNAPEDFGAIADRGAARIALQELLKEVDAYRDIEINSVADQARTMGGALTRLKVKLTGKGELTTSDADELNATSLLFTGFANNAHAAVLSALKAGLSGLFNPLSLAEIDAAVGEPMHALFLKPDEDKLEKVKEVLEKTKALSEKAKWVADKALTVMSDIEKAEKIFQVSEKLEKFGGVIETLITVKNMGQDLLLLSGGIGGGESVLGGADAIETGVDLAGLVGKKFMAAVPLFGDYWNKYLVPLTKKACEKLRNLEAKTDQINRDYMGQLILWTPVPGGWRPQPTPPELPATVYATMSGGRPVFEFLYLTRVERQPELTREVEKIVMGHREMLEKASGSEIELEKRTLNPASWINRRPVDLPRWVATNIRTVWMAFYGGAGLGPT